MLPPVPALERITLAHGQDPWSPTTSSTSGGAYSGLDPFVGLYIHTVKIVWGIPMMTSILWLLVGASSSSSLAMPPEPDSSDDYPKIGVGAYDDSITESHPICMVAPNKDPSHNNSSRYPTIGRSEVFDARTPNVGLF
jgi:hypothetical protein